MEAGEGEKETVAQVSTVSTTAVCFRSPTEEVAGSGRQTEDNEDDWAELAREERIAKKVKNGGSSKAWSWTPSSLCRGRPPDSWCMMSGVIVMTLAVSSRTHCFRKD